jgi:hypothetical protein
MRADSKKLKNVGKVWNYHNSKALKGSAHLMHTQAFLPSLQTFVLTFPSVWALNTFKFECAPYVHNRALRALHYTGICHIRASRLAHLPCTFSILSARPHFSLIPDFGYAGGVAVPALTSPWSTIFYYCSLKAYIPSTALMMNI